ncbi:mechanosensitive ion channel family protein [Thalassotalea sp. 1_MG-2023]|uniref:mechanosensitive ion channel family protein n=1 Tax=Thalassotalea sp. 1_MG-2023 TaxID=3062680 RepID=UPI0026E3B8E9|nr:mechanosensitive ion channel family protein [Thalassotalea sp. 1_MG-2023]MDO6427701.1 mechanosensitive ion channel family protein [Thalassotalea sp. 1_MG-2023]
MQTQFVLDNLAQFVQVVVDKLPAFFAGILIFLIFWLLSKPIAGFITKPFIKPNISQLVQLVIRRTTSILIVLVGLYIFLHLVGLTQFAVAILSGTGVLGLIIGFAFKDIAENFLSSLLLSVQRPFKLGDIIEVEGYLGVVNKMTSRATTLVDLNGDHIQLPNSTIYKNAIRNLTANPNIRCTVDVGIGYDANVDYAQSLVAKIMRKQQAVLNEPVPQVLVNSLGSSTCNLRLYFWINSEVNSKQKVASVLMKSVVEVFMQEGISMPDDARERIMLAPENSGTTSQIKQEAPNLSTANNSQNNYHDDDTSSDHDDIREQAVNSRDPEEGHNIL